MIFSFSNNTLFTAFMVTLFDFVRQHRSHHAPKSALLTVGNIVKGDDYQVEYDLEPVLIKRDIIIMRW